MSDVTSSPPPEPPVEPAPGPAPEVGEPGYSALAIVGFILSIITNPAGLIVSIIAVFSVRKSGKRGAALAKAGVAIGSVLTALGVIFIVILVIGSHDLKH